MWILYDWLKDYKPMSKIISGGPVLKNARLFLRGKSTEKSNVYVGTAGDILNSEERNVICVNGQDMIFLKTEDAEQVLNDVLNAFDYYNSWHERLQEMVISECSLQYLIDIAQKFFDEIISMADPAFSNTTLSVPENTDMSDDFYQNMIHKKMQHLDLLMEINRDNRTRDIKRKDAYIIENKLMPCRLICVNLVVNSQHYGWIALLERNHHVTQGKLDIFSAYARILEFWLGHNKEHNEIKSYQ
jgi:hypothetical protein